MEKERLETLTNLAASPITRYSEVVYFLVEVRKLIECKEEGRYPALEFFCDWILHDKMDRKNARMILEQFNSAVDDIKSKRYSIPDVVKRLEPLISLATFRHDLSALALEHKLDTQFINDLPRFSIFLSLYIDIISKAPLTTKNQTIPLIDTISVSKTTTSLEQNASDDNLFLFGIDWSLRKDNVEVLAFCNEVSIPKNPNIRFVTFTEIDDEEGKPKRLAPESKSLFG